MMLFKQQQSILTFDSDIAIIESVSETNVNLNVKLNCTNSNANIVVVLSPYGQATPTTVHGVDNVNQLFVSPLVQFYNAIAFPVSTLNTNQIINEIDTKISGSIYNFIMQGADDVRLIASKCVNAIGDNLLSAVQKTKINSHTHEATFSIPISLLYTAIKISAYASVDNETIATISSEINLLDRIVELQQKLNNPIIKVRKTNDSFFVLTNATQTNPVNIYTKQVGSNLNSDYDTLTIDSSEQELNFIKSKFNAMILIASTTDRKLEKSSGVRVNLPSIRPLNLNANVFIMPNDSGVEINLKNIINTELVTIRKKHNNITSIIGPELVNNRENISILDAPSIGETIYEITLQSGSNTNVIPQQNIVIDGNNFTPSAQVTNIKTTADNSGFITQFDLNSPIQFGDATIARNLINSNASANLFSNELLAQRDLYDFIPVFGISRINKDTGDIVDVGAFQSGTFVDTVIDASIKNIRYVVNMSLRDPRSLLTVAKTVVSGSQPYTYDASIFKHPFALNNGTLVNATSKNLRHPTADSLIGSSIKSTIVDVSFEQSNAGIITVSANRLTKKTVLIKIDDNLFYTRDGYVVIACYDNKKFELVGFVNSFDTSTHKIYHEVNSTNTSIIYGIAVINKNFNIDDYIVGPIVTIT